jgi:hypothetical protein
MAAILSFSAVIIKTLLFKTISKNCESDHELAPDTSPDTAEVKAN